MNNTKNYKKYKKIIAKEFLYLISTLLLIGFVYLGLILYNIYIERNINNIYNNISILNIKYQIFIDKPIKIKNSDILKKYVATANTRKYNSDWDLINSIFPELNNYDKNILQEYVATANNGKYGGNWNIVNSKFPEYFIKQSDVDSLKYFNTNKILYNKNLIYSKSKLLPKNEINGIIKTIVMLLFALNFGLRYLYYATRWSIKTIKYD